MSFFQKSQKHCSHSPKIIFNLNEINYWASDGFNIDKFDRDLIINLTVKPGIKAGSNIWNIPQLAKYMKYKPEEIILMWKDFSAPPVDPGFWLALDAYAQEKVYNDVCFHCMQGHGRTGTALSAMLIANLKLDAETAIKQIRRDHCLAAVESAEQIAYLFELDIILNGREYDMDIVDNTMFALLNNLKTSNDDIRDILKRF